jgi:hypothetical protein
MPRVSSRNRSSNIGSLGDDSTVFGRSTTPLSQPVCTVVGTYSLPIDADK